MLLAIIGWVWHKKFMFNAKLEAPIIDTLSTMDSLFSLKLWINLYVGNIWTCHKHDNIEVTWIIAYGNLK